MESPKPSQRSRPLSAARLAEAGWRSLLAATVCGALALVGLSGLISYFGPFSVGAQLLLLLHTIVGLCLVGPLAVYAARHLRTWMRQRATAAMFLGYALLLTATVAMATGLVNAALAAWGSRLDSNWELVHLVAGIGTTALLLTHLALAMHRRRLQAQRDRGLRSAITAFSLRTASALLAIALPIGALALLWPRQQQRFAPPAEYSLPAYAQQFDEYRGNPFAPTFARTDDLQLIAPSTLSGSSSCGNAGCHEQILAEWQPSAHRFSAMNAPFQAVQRQFAADREPAETRYCAGCHDPISLFAGAKDIHNQELSAPGVDEGISCAVCHSISQVDERGNADYVLTAPRKYLWENRRGLRRFISNFLIRAYPAQHLADYDRALLRTPEFCGTCHKQFIPEALNRFGMVTSQNQYDEWKNSSWHRDDPAVDLACRDCHMRLVPSQDPGRGEAGDQRRSDDDGSHRHHGTIATNNFMPAVLDLPNWQQHVELTNQWMRGETVLPEIAEIWPRGPVASIELIAPERARAGEMLELRVVVTNRKAGHNFITGPLDFIRSWVHLRVSDGRGRLLVEHGEVDPTTRRIQDGADLAGGDEGTLMLQSMPIDEHGNVLRQHQLWNKAGGRGKRVIFPRYSDSQSYSVALPPQIEGPVTVEASLNYRRYRQEFLDLVVPGLEARTGVFQPTVSQSSTSTTVAVDR